MKLYVDFNVLKDRHIEKQGGRNDAQYRTVFSRHTASLLISLSTVSITAFAANPGFFLGGCLFAGTYATSTTLLKLNQKRKVMHIAGITKDEYKHIDLQLSTANKHIQTLSQNYLRVRSVSAFKQLLEMTRISKTSSKLSKLIQESFTMWSHFSMRTFLLLLN